MYSGWQIAAACDQHFVADVLWVLAFLVVLFSLCVLTFLGGRRQIFVGSAVAAGTKK